MTIVVADSSPIHYLVQIGAIDVLVQLFDEVLLPKRVEQELLDHSAPQEVRHWILNHPKWAAVRSASCVVPLDLDPGETEAIALAKEVRAFAVLLDDGPARKAAKRAGLNVTGTLGILERASLSNLLARDSVRKRGKS